jgi:hypothetical protein
VLWFAGPAAKVLFGQEAAVAALVSRFCRWLLPGLWPMVGIGLVVTVTYCITDAGCLAAELLQWQLGQQLAAMHGCFCHCICMCAATTYV